MARPELPLDFTLYESAKLASRLRHARGACGLTYDELSLRAHVSAATLKRAASTVGRVARRYVVERYAGACGSEGQPAEELVASAVRLWKRARYAEARPGRYYEHPRPEYIHDWRDYSGRLRDLHACAGLPSVQEMEVRAGIGHLPHSTAHRIITARSVPTTVEQLESFLRACEEFPSQYVLWRGALAKCLAGGSPTSFDLRREQVPAATDGRDRTGVQRSAGITSRVSSTSMPAMRRPSGPGGVSSAHTVPRAGSASVAR